MTPHTTPPLAQQLRSLAASAPTLHRPALAAAADAVEELSKLRAERDAAKANRNMYDSAHKREAAAHLRTLAERDALRQFAREMMYAWPDGGIEGGELQESAVRCGLLTEVKRDQWCGDNCACAEFHDWDDDALPVTCLRKAAWLNKDAP